MLEGLADPGTLHIEIRIVDEQRPVVIALARQLVPTPRAEHDQRRAFRQPSDVDPRHEIGQPRFRRHACGQEIGAVLTRTGEL